MERNSSTSINIDREAIPDVVHAVVGALGLDPSTIACIEKELTTGESFAFDLSSRLRLTVVVDGEECGLVFRGKDAEIERVNEILDELME